jgi:thiosulfate reductase cytochrome b subunit
MDSGTEEGRAFFAHTRTVRVTHWMHVLVFTALLVSGIAILIAHPRLYWGESGNFNEPALLNLPLPVELEQTGWGRSLHFLSAWLLVLNGCAYVASGLRRRHFSKVMSAIYTTAQRRAYLAVLFLLAPVMVITGLAMSPAVTSVFPWMVRIWGGHQSARTVHFFAASALVAFTVGHVAMVYLAGFRNRMRAMVLG